MKNTITSSSTKSIEMYWPPEPEFIGALIKSANNKLLGRIRELHDLDLEMTKRYGSKLLMKDVFYGSEFGKLCWQYLNNEITWEEIKQKIREAFAYGNQVIRSLDL